MSSVIGRAFRGTVDGIRQRKHSAARNPPDRAPIRISAQNALASLRDRRQRVGKGRAKHVRISLLCDYRRFAAGEIRDLRTPRLAHADDHRSRADRTVPSPRIVFMFAFSSAATFRAAADVLQTNMATRSGCRFHVLGQGGKCEVVPDWTRAANHSQRRQRDKRLVVHRFATMNVGDMNFDNRKFGRLQRIEQRHRRK